MKCIVYRAARDFEIISKPDPRVGSNDVLVRPRAVGLCLTDKQVYEAVTHQPRGMVGGHEFCGEIVEVGREVEGLRLGQLVSIDPRIYCGNCRACHAGLETMCERGWAVLGVSAGRDGGLAELCAVPAYGCYEVPAGMTPEAAACVEPMCCATRAVRHSGVRIGDNAVIFGGDDYSLFAARWLRSAGVNRVVVVDPLAVRREGAARMGAHETLDPRADDVVGTLRRSMPIGADVVFVACEEHVKESDQYLAQAFAVCRPQGTVVVLRVSSATPYAAVHHHLPWLKEIRLLQFGNFFGNEPVQGGRDRGDWQLTLDAILDGRVCAPPPGTRCVRFEDLCDKADVDDVYQNMHHHVKTLIIAE